MERVFQVGHWEDETEVVWDHTYDISNLIAASRIARRAWEAYHKYVGALLPLEYTREMCEQRWNLRNLTPERAQSHFEREKASQEAQAQRQHAAHQAYLHLNAIGDDVDVAGQEHIEVLLKFLDGYDGVGLNFQVVEIDNEWVEVTPVDPGDNEDEDND